MTKRRVVITGLGAVSSLGLDLNTTWDKLLAGASGAGTITRFDTSKHTTKFACEMWDWESDKQFPRSQAKRLEKFTMYYLVAADEAKRYHSKQLGWLAETEIDMVTGLTFTQSDEAIGFVRAARAAELP